MGVDGTSLSFLYEHEATAALGVPVLHRHNSAGHTNGHLGKSTLYALASVNKPYVFENEGRIFFARDVELARVQVRRTGFEEPLLSYSVLGVLHDYVSVLLEADGAPLRQIVDECLGVDGHERVEASDTTHVHQLPVARQLQGVHRPQVVGEVSPYALFPRDEIEKCIFVTCR